MSHELAKREPTRAELIVAAKFDVPRMIADFLEAQSAATRLSYEKDLQYYADFSGHATVNAALAFLFEQDAAGAHKLFFEYKTYLKKVISKRTRKSLAPNTINRRLAALNSVCTFARRLQRITWKVELQGVKRVLRKDTAGPSLEHIDTMLDESSAHADPWHAARDIALLTLLFKNALRANEVLTLELAHLDLGEKTLWALRKGKTERVPVPLTSETLASLSQWLQHRGRNPGALFLADRSGAALPGRTMRHIIKRIGVKSGVKPERARPHGLRHTSLNEADKHMTRTELQAFSGHEHGSSLDAYLKASDGAARRAAESLDGKLKKRTPLPPPSRAGQ